MAGTSLSERIEWAEQNLQRQLDWIERHDTRTGAILGIDVAMLGFLASEISNPSKLDGSSIFFVTVTATAITVSLVAIYFSQYPKTKSPNNSLVFFGTIASFTREQFSSDFCSRTERDHLADLCEQAHINASIISKKFSALKISLIFLLLAVPPWAISIFVMRTLFSM